jgi:hypothetical protein
MSHHLLGLYIQPATTSFCLLNFNTPIQKKKTILIFFGIHPEHRNVAEQAGQYNKSLPDLKICSGFITLISLNGMSKLFSNLESRPSSLAACLKFLLVAANAFILFDEMSLQNRS